MTRTTALLVSFLVLPAAAPAQVPPPERAEVSGQVVDDLGTPVAGAVVHFNEGNDEEPYNSTVTDADGRYALTLLPGLYMDFVVPPELWQELPCAHPDCGDQGTEIPVDPGETVSGIDFTLAVPLGSIRGRVTDSADVPIAGAEVTLFDEHGLRPRPVETKEDGSYAFRGLAAGTYFLRVGSDGFLPELWDDVLCPTWPVGIACDPTTGTPIELASDDDHPTADVVLERAGGVAGVARDAATGFELAYIRVWAIDAEDRILAIGETDFDGRYELSGVGPGRTTFVRTSGLLPYIDEVWDDVPCIRDPLGTCDLEAATPVEIREGETTTGIDFDLVLGGVLRGTVRDALAGQPIAASWVQLWTVDGRHVTDLGLLSDGSFRASGLPTGHYLISTAVFRNTNQGFVDEVYDDVPCRGGLGVGCTAAQGTPIPVALGETTTIDIALERPGGAIAGTVRDPAGEPLRKVPVHVLTLGGEVAGTATSRVDGRFAVLLPIGDYVAVTMFEDNRVNQLWDVGPCVGVSCDPLRGTPIRVRNGEITSGIDFVLPVGAVIGGEVRTPTSPLLPGRDVEVEVLDAAGRRVTRGEPAPGGRYRAEGLPAGTYLVRTRNRLGLVDQVWRGLSCFDGECPLEEATPIELAAGAFQRADLLLLDLEARPRVLLGNGGRFEVTVRWQASDGRTGAAQGFPLTADTAAFWFFNPANLELVVKVLDACTEPPGAFWFFAAGLTDVGVEITVRDTWTNETRVYSSPVGEPFQPIQDTRAFQTCP